MRTGPALVLVLVLAGCSGHLTTADPSPSPSGTPLSTVLPPPSVNPTSPPASASPTPAASTTATPTVAAVHPAADGDVDGDGKADAVRATAETLTVTLSGTGRTVTAPVHADSPAAPEVLGSTDVDRDGHAEVFLKTTQGASTAFATPYRFDGAVLHELQLDGRPALLGFGGSTQHGDGFRCTGGRIEVRKAEASGSRYTVALTVYRLTPTALARVRTSSTTAREGSAEVQASYTVDCGSVGEGG